LAHNVACKRNLVDIFNHSHQMAARVGKYVLIGAFDTTILGEGDVVGDQQWWIPIGSPL